jgi:hypothetical protein
MGALLARVMDTAFVIPGTNIRFGLDSIIDLFPGIGDAVGAVISSVLIAHAAKVGVPRIVLARMAGNVVLNSLVGAIPFLGAVLSIFYRSNVRNYALLRKHAGQRISSHRGDWIFVVGLLAGLLTFLGFLVVGSIMLVKHLAART